MFSGDGEFQTQKGQTHASGSGNWLTDSGVRGCARRTAARCRKGVTVRWYRLGLTPEEIADRVGHLNLVQVHAALAYYHANQVVMESEIAADDAAAEQAQSDAAAGAKS